MKNMIQFLVVKFLRRATNLSLCVSCPLLVLFCSRREICERLSAAKTTAFLTRLLLFPGAPRTLLKL